MIFILQQLISVLLLMSNNVILSINCDKSEETPNRKIVGGVKSSITVSPYLASVQRLSSKMHFCAANIIADQWMLSCGHCFYLK